MANMGYCRFHNTLLALRECLEDLNDGEQLSEEEAKAKDALLALCHDIWFCFGDDEAEDDEEIYVR